MLSLALALGIFSYIVFLLGIFHLLYLPTISVSILLFFGIWIFLLRENIHHFVRQVIKNITVVFDKKWFIKNIFLVSISSLFILQIVINFIGALGPDISFDALWYHLTLAKLYNIHHTISFIPGGLLYYSAMPKLAELFFTAGLSFGFSNAPEVLHFLFGVLSCIVVYKIARTFVNNKLALVSVLIFYSNLVIGWESVTAYIDLVRVFFEGVSLYAFMEWTEKKNMRFFYVSALLVGFAITTKLLAVSSLGILMLLAADVLYKKVSFQKLVLYEAIFFGIALSIPLPWFIFSYVHTGNPLYPFFTPYFSHLQQTTVTGALLHPFHILQTYWHFLTDASDPISPLYIAVIPLLIVLRNKFNTKEKLILFYTISGLCMWYFISHVEGTRIALPYIFSFSVLGGIILQKISKQIIVYRSLLVFIYMVALISIGYRIVANEKFLPVVFGYESKTHFLSTHLNFSFGDWYDVDGYMKKNIKPNDTVLLYGYHNLYYVDFPYIHETWVKKGDRFNYIATDGRMPPERFKSSKLIYQNATTHIHLYNEGGNVWTY